MHPPPNALQQREEMLKREESRREEQERRSLEVQLRTFDAHDFYDSLENWASQPVPSPVRQTIRLTPLRQKTIVQQPLPLSRKELADLRKLSSDCTRLLYLLRAIDQRGIECPYVHQVHRRSLERAIEKCDRLQVAEQEYGNRTGIKAFFAQLFQKAHLVAIRRDLDFFKSRLESMLTMCRHEEFAQELMHVRRPVTYRAGSVLTPTDPQGRGHQANTSKAPARAQPRASMLSLLRKEQGMLAG